MLLLFIVLFLIPPFLPPFNTRPLKAFEVIMLLVTLRKWASVSRYATTPCYPMVLRRGQKKDPKKTVGREREK